MSTYKFVDPENARGPEMKAWYEDIAARGIDPFERDHFVAHHPQPILFENDHWTLTYNAKPYENTGLHLLLVHVSFITHIGEITPDGWLGLSETIAFAQKEFGFESGAFLLRFGDTSQTGGSVTHLHAHIIVAQKDGKKHAIYPVVT